jgi:tetratricopeptide (TPR) repeat protein
MRKIASGEISMGLSVSDEEPLPDEEDQDFQVDSIRGTLSEGPVIMNAIRDSETGEMVATDVISASKVTARFRNVAERAGYVSISFDVSVPAGMSDSRWQIKISPGMRIQQDTVGLDPIFITGAAYRAAQLRGYERYQAFLSSIITDPADMVRLGQLEVFLKRHFPETYAMKTDSSFVSEPLAENLFGVTQRQALEHYRKHLKIRMNDRRRARVDKMYRKYVKDPIVKEGVRLDTVLVGDGGDFIYRYTHTFQSRPRLKKVAVALSGSLYERGEKLFELPFPEDLTFYISSLATLADERPKYRMIILERTVYDNTKALIDFHQGRAEVDTTLGDNASELRRIRRCIDDVVAREEFVLDSLVVVASCSPEGAYSLNRKLSRARSRAMMEYIQDYVPEQWRDSLRMSQLPENWEQLERLIVSDSLFNKISKDRIMDVIRKYEEPDRRERELSRMTEYRYLREKLYPQLRSVRFDFHLHRAGMVKDTVHTTELDTVYMAGVQALKDLDYKKAVGLLRPYGDYNSALAFMSADYNHSALSVLDSLDDTDAKVCYLKAMVLSRLGQMEEAMKYFELALAYDPYLEHRANLDPEMHYLINKYKQL